MRAKNVLIGITGGIAAYKMCELTSLLRKQGAHVQIVMTTSAEKFITPLTMQTLCGNQVYTETPGCSIPKFARHIGLTRWCDILVIAPASANTIAKIAHGITNNLLTAITMSLPKEKPMIIAPAMNTAMWKNKIVQKNIGSLRRSKNCTVLSPRVSRLACGETGEGALAEIADIVALIKTCTEGLPKRHCGSRKRR